MVNIEDDSIFGSRLDSVHVHRLERTIYWCHFQSTALFSLELATFLFLLSCRDSKYLTFLSACTIVREPLICWALHFENPFGLIVETWASFPPWLKKSIRLQTSNWATLRPPSKEDEHLVLGPGVFPATKTGEARSVNTQMHDS